MTDNMSLGLILTNIRTELGLSQQDIASQLNINKNIVIDIENDHFSNVPFIFMKNYIRSYAHIINLPPEEYECYLDKIAHDLFLEKIKYHAGSNKKSKKKCLIVSLILLVCLLSVVSYYSWAESQKNKTFVEVNEYITPSSQKQVEG